MSGFHNSMNGSNPDNTGRSFAASFVAQSGAANPVFHQSGTLQGLHNMHGSFNVPNMQGTLGSRNSTINNIPSSGVQQPSANLSSGRFASNNLPVGISQMSHGSSHGYSGMTNRGGAIPGILPTSGAAVGNRSAVPGLGVSPMLGNTGSRITSSVGNMVGGGNIGRNVSSGGGLSVPPGLASRLNLTGHNSSGNLTVQAPNRLMSGMLQQASPQVISMLGNSYPSGGPLSHNHVQSMNSMGMLNDVNSNDGAPFDINDFPQLTSRPTSSGGPQGQIGSLRKQGLGASSIVQQNQEFSIQNEDFPALPGYKGGGSAEYSMGMHQKEQLQENTPASMIQQQQQQPQQFSMGGRSAGFNLGGGSFSPHRPQQQQQQDLLHMQGSDLITSSHSTYQSQTSGPPGIGSRPPNSQNTVSSMGSYDQLIQQYQQQQNPSQLRLQQITAASQSKSMQAAQAAPDPYGLLGLLNVIGMKNPNLTSLALGIDLTTLGLNLNSSENLYKSFSSPWSNEPAKGDPDFTLPQCYIANKQPPSLSQGQFGKSQLSTLFYIFYSMPKEEAQLYAANELHNRGWFYHKDHRCWFMRNASMEPPVKTSAYERGSYVCFDPNKWETVRKDNIVIHYDKVEKRPTLPQH